MSPLLVASRQAGEDDLEELVALYRRFQAEIGGERGGSVHISKEGFAEPLEDVLRTAVRDQSMLALIGTLDDVPIGLAVARLEVLRDSSKLVSVEVLYVERPAREVGVGEELVNSIAAWADRQGAVALDVGVLPGMREAKNFLEKAGFAARLLVMHRRID